ncbi:MAG: hypothetical protein PHW92_08700 [Lutibacter sp.]|nr:hypothetical protein [Lutibacter sp.]
MREHEQIRQLKQHLGTLKKDACELALNLSENYLRFEEKLMFPYLENTLHKINWQLLEKPCRK